MDYTEVCQGWVYYIKNKINGKMYIGKTIEFEVRKKRHLKWRQEACPILQRAIDKYGAENFEMEPILTFNAINRNVCEDVLSKLEVYYIKKYNTYNDGYNATLGGEGRVGVVVSKETAAKISAANKGRKYSLDVRERVSNGNVKNVDFSEYSILMYDLNGVFVRQFDNYFQAAKYLDRLSDANITRLIHHAATTDNCCTCGYMWKYTNTTNFPVFIEPYKSRKFRRIYWYTKDNELKATFSTIQEAMKQTGKGKSCIVNSLNNVRTMHYGDWWSYDAPSSPQGMS